MKRKRFIIAAAAALFIALPVVAQHTIETIVGNYDPTGAPAVTVPTAQPKGIALDSAGNVYASATAHHRVYRIDPSGTIHLVAGSGLPGFSGDGGPATNAVLSYPHDLAVDGAGNLWIADTYNHRIRRVDSAGIITTVAGNGTGGFSGDGGPATSAMLHLPHGVAVDGAGQLHIADTWNNRIRRVNVAGIISTVAGNGTYGFSGDGGLATNAMLRSPFMVAVDGAGNLFIADHDSHRIRRVDAAGGIITTVAGNGTSGFSGDGGLATNASLKYPRVVAVDGAGSVYIADTENHRIRRVDTFGIITTVAGDGSTAAPIFWGDGGPASKSALNYPNDVAPDSAGNTYIADRYNNRIRKVDASTGIISTVAGNGMYGFSGDGGPATQAALRDPRGLGVDSAGNLFIVDIGNNRIRKVDALTGIISTVAGNGSGVFSGDGGPATQAGLQDIWGVAVDSSGNLFITNTNSHRVRKVDASTGIISTVVGTGTAGSFGDGGPATQARLDFPFRVALDAADNLFIADTFGHRIRKVDASTGIISTVAGNGGYGFSGDGGPATNAMLAYPMGLAVDAAGNLIISDTYNHRIRRVLGVATPRDTTPPVVTAEVSGTLGDAGWHTSDVTVTWTVSDDETAVTSTSGCDSASVTSDTAGQTFTCSATSVGGTSVESVTVKRDATPPTITYDGQDPAANAAGWNNTGVTLYWICDDDLSGAVGNGDSRSLSSEGSDLSATGSCTDRAGNTASDSQSGIRIDMTAPTIALTAPSAGVAYALNAAVAASYTCDDGLSGVATCDGPVAHGAAIPTAAVGAHGFTVNASDPAGNTATLSQSYNVRYVFVGFLSPVDNLPVMNEAKAGRTIPVKWRLQDAHGVFVTNTSSMISLLSGPIACDASPTTIVEEQLSSPGSTVFRYDETSNQFIYNWQSASGWKNCRQLQLQLADGTYHYAKFRFK